MTEPITERPEIRLERVGARALALAVAALIGAWLVMLWNVAPVILP